MTPEELALSLVNRPGRLQAVLSHPYEGREYERNRAEEIACALCERYRNCDQPVNVTVPWATYTRVWPESRKDFGLELLVGCIRRADLLIVAAYPEGLSHGQWVEIEIARLVRTKVVYIDVERERFLCPRKNAWNE